MSFLVPNEGEAFFLDRFVAKGSYSFSSSLGMRLFNANITPSETDTVSTYYPASVATFAGYAPISLSAASWTITEGNPSVASYSNQQIGSNPVFTSNTDGQNENIYGMFISYALNKLLFVEKFSDGPYLIQNNGDSITVDPTIYFN